MSYPGSETSRSRGQWSSEPAFIFSMAAAAVGLGNLWRFPYMVGEHGGAAFILAYLLALVIICLPIMYLEVAAGRLAQGNTVHTYRQVNRFGAWYGWFVVGLTFLITSYYLVITGWTLGYALDALRNEVKVFDEFSSGYASLYYFFAILVLASLVLMRGLSAIERFSKFLMPVLLAVIIGLVIVASRMEGWAEARRFLLHADFSAWRNPDLWVMAFGQGFYTLAIGQGYLVTYGSYIPRKAHVPRACLVVGVTETCIALLAGWMIFPFVFTFGMDPGEGSQLAFSTLPRVFEHMAWGYPVALLFFSLFFLAAFSSSLAGLKVVISAVAEELRLSHGKAVLAVAGVLSLIGIPSALSFSPISLTIGDEPSSTGSIRQLAGKPCCFQASSGRHSLPGWSDRKSCVMGWARLQAGGSCEYTR
ncbi:sodium-dependent transporter [Halomonas sp. BC04]|uniref:sodium-dependent transporter n=1 Tax=Halomonas sp. BC04 TaxID=1403540 RepID=UPI0004BB93BD|nr:sodium-dependent transporter [Halomonas sp. BC04]